MQKQFTLVLGNRIAKYWALRFFKYRCVPTFVSSLVSYFKYKKSWARVTVHTIITWEFFFVWAYIVVAAYACALLPAYTIINYVS